MTLDPFYAGSAVDVLYPSQIMSNHPFSGPEWNPSHLVRLLQPSSGVAAAGGFPYLPKPRCRSTRMTMRRHTFRNGSHRRPSSCPPIPPISSPFPDPRAARARSARTWRIFSSRKIPSGSSKIWIMPPRCSTCPRSHRPKRRVRTMAGNTPCQTRASPPADRLRSRSPQTPWACGR